MPKVADAPLTGPDSPRVRRLRGGLAALADGVTPVIDLCKPFIDGIENLPEDGRCLLVGNHTQVGAAEVLLIPYTVYRTYGQRVRPLAERGIARFGGLQADVVAAFGGVVGTPDNARELMRHAETILVFPGGAREIMKCKGEEYTLRWHDRFGFARLAAEFAYPIVPVGLVGGDDVYHTLTTRDSLWGRLSARVSRLTGQPGQGFPLVRGLGPTLIPRPQRMYLRFGTPIETTKPGGVASDDEWATKVKNETETRLSDILGDLQDIRAADPYRTLNPLRWASAVTPQD